MNGKNKLQQRLMKLTNRYDKLLNKLKANGLVSSLKYYKNLWEVTKPLNDDQLVYLSKNKNSIKLLKLMELHL